jgi:parallel beta-helix repeat protein
MRRTILIAVLVLGLAVALLSLGTSSGTQDQPECTVTVQPGESIQAAIDKAEEGAVICLAEGTWEENLVIGKGLTLRGLGPEKSVIKGVKEGEPVILIISDAEIGVIVEGLTLAKAKGGCAEWPLRCADGLSFGGRVKATIRGNTISRNWDDGISMRGSAQATISGNTIWGNRDGISMRDSAQATIEENAISGNAWGINIRASAQATISGNTISGNGYGISMGDSTQATIEENTISENKEHGISMGGSAQATIEENTISGNERDGISMLASAQATISGNTISGNEGDGISMMWGSAQATIEENTISGNWDDGISMLASAQATIEENKITDNKDYGVALYQRPCYDTPLVFGGAVRGRVNEISGNKKGEVCPAELAFLMTEAGGCYGPLCR